MHVDLARRDYDVVVIGAGQAGLAVAYYLRRSGLSFLVLDAGLGPGGAWQHTWDSLALFSPAQASSLPGRFMPGGRAYPGREEVLAYFSAYEERYKFPILRPVLVHAVSRAADGQLVVAGDRGEWRAAAVVSATGNWSKPYIPEYPGQDLFNGRQLHSAYYRRPDEFRDQRVLVVGARNSAAQIYAEVSLLAQATWVTRQEPRFLPDDVDGRFLFERATAEYQARQEGNAPPAIPQDALGHIIMVPPVREARERGVLHSVRPFTRFTENGVVWADGRESAVDAVIWCTGFRPALDHLTPLGVVDAAGRIATLDTHSLLEPRLWLVGYGEWTGFASATLIGVGRTARQTVEEIRSVLLTAAAASS